jgi:hypothetical protein
MYHTMVSNYNKIPPKGRKFTLHIPIAPNPDALLCPASPTDPPPNVRQDALDMLNVLFEFMTKKGSFLHSVINAEFILV